MAGRYTRQEYDAPAYREKIKRSTDPMNYRLDPTYAVNCESCFAEYGPRGAYGAGSSIATGQQIDVESILQGYTKINSKYNEQQLPDSLEPYKRNAPRNCPPALESEYSRFTHPSYDIRGLTVPDLHFDYPLFDPQCQIFESFAVNTKLQAKDNHKSIWQIPVDQKDLFPVERLGNVKNCDVGLNCNYAKF
jgi:hypothetical protein